MYPAILIFLTVSLVTNCEAWMPQAGQGGRLASAQLFPQRAAPWSFAIGGNNLYGDNEMRGAFGQLSHQNGSWGASTALSNESIDTIYQSVTWAAEGRTSFRNLFAWGRHEHRFHRIAGSTSFWTPESRIVLGMRASPVFSVATGIRKENHCLLPDFGLEWNIGNTVQMDFYLTKSSQFIPWECTLGQSFAIAKGSSLELGWGYPSKRIAFGLYWSTSSLAIETSQTYVSQLPPTNSGSCSFFARRE